jgi:hypothetical protein
MSAFARAFGAILLQARQAARVRQEAPSKIARFDRAATQPPVL